MSVISLQDKRIEREPHLNACVRCLGCRHEWRAVTPVGVIAGLECPNCGAMQGVTQGLVAPETRFVCNCGSDLYFILPDGCRCALCGVWQGL